MRMQYGLSAYERGPGGLPELPCINMYAEKAPTEETGIMLQSRKGLVQTASLGSNVQAAFQKDGVLSGAQFHIVDAQLFEDGVLVGPVDGAGPFFMDGYSDKLFVAGGGYLWGYDGTTLAVVTFPDTANVTSIVVGASRLVALRADTEQYYWSGVLDDVIDGLAFASAESQPDLLRDVLFIDDTLVLFGDDTVEFHINTGDADAPFTPLEGRVFESGIKTTGACVGIGSSFAWVTSDNRLCMGDPDTVLSNEGLEEKIAASASVRLWAFYIDATEFLALRLDDHTYVMPLRTRTWHRWQTYGQDNWTAQCYAGGTFGTSDGKLAAWGTYEDFGTVLERRFRGGFPLNAGGMMVSNIILRTNPGETTYLTGDYTDPVVEMRLSRNRGKTWGEWRATTLGEQGNYAKRVQWRSCGMASQPGLLAEWRLTAPVDWRVSEVLVNEGWGGR
jgi:hypothetical protein